MAKPQNIGEVRTLELKVPEHMHDFLTELAKATVMGVTPNEVAKYILTKEVDRLIEEKRHEAKWR